MEHIPNSTPKPARARNIKRQLKAILPSGYNDMTKPQRYRYFRKNGVRADIAAKLSGYSEGTVGALKVKEDSISDLLEIVGVTPVEIATKIKEGMEATKTRVTRDGDEIVDPDWTARHKYLNTAMELQGHVKKSENTGGNTVVVMPQITVDGEALDFFKGRKKHAPDVIDMEGT